MTFLTVNSERSNLRPPARSLKNGTPTLMSEALNMGKVRNAVNTIANIMDLVF